MIDVNIRGVLHGIATVLPHMRERKSGQIINVSSISAHRVSPTAAVYCYCATKFAVNAISPGVVEPELADTIRDEVTRELVREYRQVSISGEAIARYFTCH